MEKEKMEINKKSHKHLNFFYTQYTLPPSRCIHNLKKQDQIGAEKKKIRQIKGLISNMWLILEYTVQLIITKLCVKFQNPQSSSSREICDNFFLCIE